MVKKKWYGTIGDCDGCKTDLNDGHFFFDAKTTFGSWGLLCESCFKKYGVGLGSGLGQKYDTVSMEKVNG